MRSKNQIKALMKGVTEMELRVIHYFLTVAEEGTFSAAAEKLHITQPTLSRQIKGLEEELGTILFMRTGNRLELTKEGYFFLNRGREILDLTNQTYQDFSDMKQELFKGHLSIGCIEGRSSDILTGVLEEMLADYPDITFSIFSGTSDMIIEKLDFGILDVALVMDERQFFKWEYVSLPEEEQWGILVSAEHQLAHQETVRPKDLLQEKFLMSNRSYLQEGFSDWLGYDLKDLNILGTFNLLFNIVALVDNDLAVALVIEGATKQLDMEYLKFIPLSPTMVTPTHLVWKKSRILPAVANEFIKRFQNALKA